MKTILLSLLLFNPFQTYENQCGYDNFLAMRGISQTVKYQSCPTPKSSKISSLCSFVTSGSYDETGDEKFTFAYERHLWDISCAKHEESLTDAKFKIQSMWKKHSDKLMCNDTDTAGKTVSVAIKSIQTNFPEFIYDLILKYEIDVETKVNGENVFDYIDRRVKELEKLGGFENKIKSLQILKKDIQKLIAEKKKSQKSPSLK